MKVRSSKGSRGLGQALITGAGKKWQEKTLTKGLSLCHGSLHLQLDSSGVVVMGTTTGDISGNNIGSSGDSDYFIAKFLLSDQAPLQAGDVIWKNQIGGGPSSHVNPSSNYLMMDNDGYNFVLGSFDAGGSLVGPMNVTDGLGTENAFLGKFNSDGEFQ